MAFLVKEFPNRTFESFDELKKLRYIRQIVKERLKSRKARKVAVKVVLKKDSLPVMVAQLLMNSPKKDSLITEELKDGYGR